MLLNIVFYLAQLRRIGMHKHKLPARKFSCAGWIVRIETVLVKTVPTKVRAGDDRGRFQACTVDGGALETLGEFWVWRGGVGHETGCSEREALVKEEILVFDGVRGFECGGAINEVNNGKVVETVSDHFIL
jgi:hypothetical protein